MENGFENGYSDLRDVNVQFGISKIFRQQSGVGCGSKNPFLDSLAARLLKYLVFPVRETCRRGSYGELVVENR
jgi:hypothetical protein